MLFKTFHLFSLFLIVLTCSGQNKELPIFLHYENSSGENGISIFEYDGNRQLTRARWQLTDTSRWSTNYYFYDENNLLLEKYREFSDGLISSLKYGYNKNGQKISETFTRSDGISGTSTFDYNATGNLEKVNCNKYSGWFDGEIIYTYNESENPVSGTLLRNGEELGKIEFTYYENGNLKTEKWITPNWNQTFLWEYADLPQTCTSSNVFIAENSRFVLASEDYSYNGENGGPSYFRYSNDGKLIQKTFVRSDSLKTETYYNYTSENQLEKSIRNYNNGSTAEFFYTYNTNRQLTGRVCKNLNGKEATENYVYDGNGKLIRARWKNFDGWLSGTLEFEHAPNGTIHSAVFKGDEFDAKLQFEYDDFGNLGSIVWNFSFGKFQRYSFTYSETPAYKKL